MTTRKDVSHSEVLTALEKAIAEMASATFGAGDALRASDLASGISTPAQFTLGQAAIPCHPLAKTRRTAPAKIGRTLADIIN